MYKGLGLDTLKSEKEHFNVYVCKLPSVPVSEEVQTYIQFGNENEINAIATLVGLLMPALLPSCFSFFEVGPQFIDGVHRENLIEVSADGIITCTHGDSCMLKKLNLTVTRRLLLEQKVYSHQRICLNFLITNSQSDMVFIFQFLLTENHEIF